MNGKILPTFNTGTESAWFSFSLIRFTHTHTETASYRMYKPVVLYSGCMNDQTLNLKMH